MNPEALGLGPARWDGQPGMLEVWYATLTDPVTGTGVWVHAELLAGHDDPAAAHGWCAVFPPDAPPSVARFGPEPVGAVHRGDDWFAAAGVVVGPGRLSGSAAAHTDPAPDRGGAVPTMEWDLRWSDAATPLYPFSRLAWQRRLLPAAQCVLAPTATFTGTVDVNGRSVRVNDGRGAVSRIYGEGHAMRWAWLHADLGDGDVLEVVTAVSRKPLLRWVPAVAFVALRCDGEDWPSDPLVAAPRLRGEPAMPSWAVAGRVGARRLRVEVRQPAGRCVRLTYSDPDGTTATCANTERADADILLQRRTKNRWVEERSWSLRGTAHAEVGLRP